MSLNRIIDGSSIFTDDDVGKDGLKKEFGVYYEIEDGTVVTKFNQSSPYLLTLGSAISDDTGLLPFYTQTVRINSASYVSNYDEWINNLRQKFIPSAEYIDHYFVQPQHQCRTEAVNNFESYGYEFLTKQVPPLSLLNIYDQDAYPLPEDMTNYLDQFSIKQVEAQRRSNVFMGDNSLDMRRPIIEGRLPFGSPIFGPYIYETYNSFIKLYFDTSVPSQDQNVTTELFKETGLTNKLFSFFKRTSGTLLDFYADSLNTLAEVNVKDFTDFLQNYDLITMTDGTDEKFYRDFPEPSTFEAQFLRLEMLSRVRDLIQTKIRKSFQQIIRDGDEAYNLLIGYKVEKFRENTRTPVQTIFIMSSDYESYYDSLVAYDTVYNYKFTAIFMVIGNSYAYVNPIENRELGQVTMTFVNRPSVQFVELPILQEDMIVTDIPNPPPEVMFYNERGNRNEIMITLDQATIVENSSADNYALTFRSDSNNQRKVFIQQKDTQIEFSTLYTSNIYEIYRTDEEPSSYIDFSNNLLTIIGSAGVESTDNLFRDLVVPHKKYYYLIRTLTNFGIHSNPTRMYEAELIQDSDETYLKYKEFKFKEIKQIQSNKSFKKFMQIKPNLSQLNLNQELITNPAYADNYGINVIGTEQEAIWGRRFKIRITSKKTGKKIDLNVKFNLVDENTQPTN